MKLFFCLFSLLIIVVTAAEDSIHTEHKVVRIQGSTKNTGQNEDNVIRFEKEEKVYDDGHTKHRILGSMEGTDCEACKFVIRSFKLGMKRTVNKHLEDDPSDIERAKNQRYLTSQYRYDDIHEKLCLELRNPDQTRCLHMFDKIEMYVERWWKKIANKRDIDMFYSICVKSMGYCPSSTTQSPKPKKCEKGYFRNLTDDTCMDIDECVNGKANCKHGQWCLNVNGTFYCLACHPLCHNCTGGGQKNCISSRYNSNFEYLKMRLGLEWLEPGHVLLGFYMCLGLFSCVFLLVYPAMGVVGIALSLILYVLVYPEPHKVS